MNKQTFNINSFVGKQFLTLAKRFCSNFEYNKSCNAVIDTEKYTFFCDGVNITIYK